MISPGTELSIYQGIHAGLQDINNEWASYPFSPGYAAVGQIIDTGSAINGFKRDDYVYFEGNHTSHQIVNQDDFIVKLDDNAQLEKMVWARFVQIAYTSLAVNMTVSGNVLVTGGGMIGNLAAQIHREMTNNSVYLTDILDSRLRIAEQCGLWTADLATEEKGWDCIIDATGSPMMISRELKNLKNEGVLILLGSTRGNLDNFDIYSLVHRNCVKIIGAHETFVAPGHDKSQRNKYLVVGNIIKLLKMDKIIVNPLVTNKISYEKIQIAYEGLLHEKENHLGILIDWT